MFIKLALASAFAVIAMAGKPDWKKDAPAKKVTTKTVAHGHHHSASASAHKFTLSAAWHKNNASWARRQVDQWQHKSMSKHTYKGDHTMGYKYHRNAGHESATAWKNSAARINARKALAAELKRARFMRNGGFTSAAAEEAAKQKAALLKGTRTAIANARAGIDQTAKDTGKKLVNIINKAQRIKAVAIAKAKKEKAAAMLKLKIAQRTADAAVKKAAWQAKKARAHAVAIKDAMKARAATAARKAHQVKLALLKKAHIAQEKAHAHARQIERRAIALEKKTRIVEMAKAKARFEAKQRARQLVRQDRRRAAAKKYRAEQRTVREDRERYARDQRREARYKPHHHCVTHRHHYHGHKEEAYVKKQYWVKEPTQVVRKVTLSKHVKLVAFKGKSESTDKLAALQQAAMASSAAYRKEVDIVNVSNEKRYATFITKIAAARQAAMKKREMRLVIVDRKIAAYKIKLEAGASHRLQVRREIEAKKLAAIRAEYFRQLHAAETTYNKSRVIENFDKTLSTFRHQIMAKTDASSAFRAALQKKILIKLGNYRASLATLEAADLKKYKQKMTASATNLSNYTALYAAGRGVSSSRKAYWSKYAAQLGLDRVSYHTTVVHHHHHANKHVVVHHTHKTTIVIRAQHHIRVATRFAHKHLKVVTATAHRPSFPGSHHHHHAARVVKHISLSKIVKSNKVRHHVTKRVVKHISMRHIVKANKKTVSHKTVKVSHSSTVKAIRHARHLVSFAKSAIIKAKAGKITKHAAQRAVKAAKLAVVDAHKKMVRVMKHRHTTGTHKKTIVKHAMRLAHHGKKLAQTSDVVAQTEYQKALNKLHDMESEESNGIKL